MKKNKGKICLLISAFIYGLAPILAKVTYAGGANGITLTFLRGSLCVPLLYIMMKADGKSLKLSRSEFKRVLVLGIFGGALPIVLLYLSYNYISIGLATTLHFIYPLVIVIVSSLLFHEKMTKIRLIAVIFVTVGIFLFVDISSASDKLGIVLALLSGIFYSFYVIYMERSGLENMDYVKLTFYIMVIMSLTTLILGVLVHGISFDLSPKAWVYAVLISFMITLFAMPLFQAGVRYEGASTAGIMSTFEPITSVALGAMFLGEIVGLPQLLGGLMIIAGVILAETHR
ncbi:MAG: DMT family transporter [Clostridia bacterium]|nr:DMT family transporter [Clostridia bacterium]